MIFDVEGSVIRGQADKMCFSEDCLSQVKVPIEPVLNPRATV